MATTTYTVINGVIVHEDRNGVERNYRPDTLGNTIALTDATTATDTMTYWPYGEVRTRTGTTATPFQFVGTLGYYRDSGSRTYVRARHYRMPLGRWTTVDPIWPGQPAYSYGVSQPQTFADPSGLWCYATRSCNDKEREKIAKALATLVADPGFKNFIECLSPCDINLGTELGDTIGDRLGKWSECSPPADYDFIIECDSGGILSKCDPKDCAWTNITSRPPIITLCMHATHDDKCGGWKCILAHELIHATGRSHKAEGNDPPFGCVSGLKGCESYTGVSAHGSKIKKASVF